MPSSHSAMYTASSKKSTITNKLSTKNIRKNISNYDHLFAPLNNLIDLNDTDNAIASQIRCDAKEFQLGKLTPKSNVIIRKRQTHSDLVQFSYGACFAPVVSTWIKAIKMVISQLGLD